MQKIIQILVALALLLGAQASVFSQTVLDIRIASGSDDAEQSPSSSGSMDLTSTDLDLGAERICGLRFTGLSIPQGATITNAYIQFESKATGSTATVVSIKAQAADNAGAFTTTASNITSRTTGSASASWTIAEWTASSLTGTAQRTPNLSAVLQQVVNRSGWSSGNAAVFVLQGTGARVAKVNENGSTEGALLHVEYTTGGGTSSLATSPTSLSFGSASESKSISVTGNVSWTASDNQPWITVNPTSGSNNGTVTVSLTANTGSSSRSGAVTITGGSLTRTVTITQNGAGSTGTVDVRVSAGSDDAEQSPSSSGSMELTSTDLDLGAERICGLRFTGLSIPQGATITNAYIQFESKATGSTATTVSIKAQAADNPGTFTTTVSNITSRATGSASVSWPIAEWTASSLTGTEQRTPNIASVVQQVVSRSGWTTGNAMVFVLQGTGARVAKVYENGSTEAALLHVEYSSNGGGGGGTASLAASPTSLNFGSVAGNQSVLVTGSNVTWTASDNQSWITVSPTSGSNNGTVAVSVTANTGSGSRSGTVTVTGGGITRTVSITQSGANATLSLSHQRLDFPETASAQSFTISSNSAWTITNTAPYLTISPLSGTGNATISVSCALNSIHSYREATVKVSAGNLTSNLLITQEPVVIGSSATGLIRRSGDGFVYDGAGFRFIGANIPRLAHGDYGSRTPKEEMRKQIKEAKAFGGKVIRVFVGSEITSNFRLSALEQRLNWLLELGNEEDVWFIFCLTNIYANSSMIAPLDGYNQCYGTNGQLKRAWYDNGNKCKVNGSGCCTNDLEYPNCLECAGGYASNYFEFMALLKARYSQHRRIFSWELGNELQIPDNGNGSKDDERDAMLNFAYKAGQYLKSAPNQVIQMVSTGFQSVFKTALDYGTANPPSASLNTYIGNMYGSWNGQSSPFDYVTVHCYDNEWVGQGMQADISWARRNGRPYVIGEGFFKGGGGTCASASGSFPGGTWQSARDANNPSATTPILLADARNNREQATKAVLDEYFDQLGCDGAMQWALVGLNYSVEGITNHDCRRMDKYNGQSDYAALAQVYNCKAQQLLGATCNSPIPTGVRFEATKGTYQDRVELRLYNFPLDYQFRFLKNGQYLHHGWWLTPIPGEPFQYFDDYLATAVSSPGHAYAFEVRPNPSMVVSAGITYSSATTDNGWKSSNQDIPCHSGNIQFQENVPYGSDIWLPIQGNTITVPAEGIGANQRRFRVHGAGPSKFDRGTNPWFNFSPNETWPVPGITDECYITHLTVDANTTSGTRSKTVRLYNKWNDSDDITFTIYQQAALPGDFPFNAIQSDPAEIISPTSGFYDNSNYTQASTTTYPIYCENNSSGRDMWFKFQMPVGQIYFQTGPGYINCTSSITMERTLVQMYTANNGNGQNLQHYYCESSLNSTNLTVSSANVAAGTWVYMRVMGYGNNYGCFIARNWVLSTSPFDQAFDRSNPASQEEKSLPWIEIYPNPAEEQANVMFYCPDNSEGILTLTDMQGKEVSKQEIYCNKGHNVTVLDLSLLQRGVYVLRLVQGGRSSVQKKLIKQ